MRNTYNIGLIYKEKIPPKYPTDIANPVGGILYLLLSYVGSFALSSRRRVTMVRPWARLTEEVTLRDRVLLITTALRMAVVISKTLARASSCSSPVISLISFIRPHPLERVC